MGKQMLVKVDTEPIASVVIAAPIVDGRVQISNVPADKAQRLAEALRRLVPPEQGPK
jgi:hypothetical protein